MFLQPHGLLKPQHLGADVYSICVRPENAAAAIPLRQTDVSDERQRAIVSTENAMSDPKDEEDLSRNAT